jgi:hypothetical protein
MLTINAIADDKLSKDFILRKIDGNRLNFDVENGAREIVVATIMGISEIQDPTLLNQIGEAKLLKAEQMLIDDFKQKYYFFDPQMLNVRYFRDGYYKYSITFDFATTRKCTLRIERIDPKCGNPICDYSIKDPRKSANVDINGQIIPDSYCEKIYSIKIKKEIDKSQYKGE